MNVRHPHRRLRRLATFVIAFAAGLWVCDRWMARRAAADALATTRPATTRAATSHPALAADVQAVADALDATYARRPLTLAATLRTDFNVAGIVEGESRELSASIESPSRFRHEAKDELLIVADGERVTMYDASTNSYLTQPLDGGALAGELRDALVQQDPALMIAITGDAASLFAPAADTKVALEHTDGGDVVVSTRADGTVVRVAVADGRLTSVAFDFAEYLKKAGATDVTRAGGVITYTATALGVAPFADDRFAFVAPAGAREAIASPTGEMLADAGIDPVEALTNKPAPAVALNDLAGTSLKIVGDGADAGVVVLDFWATWCPPCRAGLPHLAAVAKRFAERGVRVYAVNQREEVSVIEAFLAEQKLDGFTTVLDVDGAAARAYGVSGIPQTVVIGRDGVVKKVMLGFDPTATGALDDAVENALK